MSVEESNDRLRKWRLILGKQADPSREMKLQGEDKNVDAVLEALYDTNRKGGLGNSSPNVNRWLGDIRKYFPTSVVQVMQKDALERLELTQLLLEPELLETIEPDVQLVSTLLALKEVMPEHTRETARLVVRKLVEELEKKLHNPLREAIRGSLNRAIKNRRPRLQEIDWHRTIRSNLKHYQADLQTIIVENLFGYGRKGHALKHIILLVDQSGSMTTSIVHAAVLGSIMASLRSVKTHFVAFDTAVADLSDVQHDPIELLFATQLGGGTDIAQALAYSRQLVERPSDTILVLLSDLFEGAMPDEMFRQLAALKSSGVKIISLLALNDEGTPSFDHEIAAYLAGMEIPAFACTPDQFPDLMAAAIKGEDVKKVIK